MSNKIKKIGFLIIILTMVLTNTLGSHPSVYAISEGPKIESNIVYDKDKTKAEIQLSVVNTEKKVIHEIKNPDGNNMDMGQLTWSTDKNGEYTFKVTYMDTLSNQKNTEDEKIVVDEIGVLKQQTRSFDELQIELQEQGWTDKVASFTLIPYIVIPSDVQGGIIHIHLPQYIKVNEDEIKTDLNIEAVSVTGSSDTPGGTDITLKLKDNVTGNIGKDIKISQADFIAKSKVSDYTIEAVYQSKDGIEKKVSKTFDVAIDWTRYSTYYLTEAILPNEKNIQFRVITKANLNYFGDEFKGDAIFPSELVKFLNIDVTQGRLDSNGNLYIRIDKGDIIDDHTMEKNIAISPNAEEIVRNDERYKEYTIHVQYDSGDRGAHIGEISIFYPELVKTPNETESIGKLNLLNSIQKNANVKLDKPSNEWMMKIEGIARDSKGNQVAYGGGNIDYMNKFHRDAIKNQKLSFKLPPVLELRGSDAETHYDQVLHSLSNVKTTASYLDSKAPYEAGSIYTFDTARNNLLFGLEYNFDNPQEIQRNLQATDIKLSIEYFGRKFDIGDTYSGKVTWDTDDIVPVKRIYAGKLSQGSKNEELFSLSWSAAGRTLSNGYKLPAMNTVMNIVPEKIKIRKVVFNQDILKQIKDVGLTVQYTTNLDTNKKEASLNTDLILQSNEYITAIYLDSKSYVYDSSVFNDNAKFITFYGDVEEQTEGADNYHLDINSTILNSGLPATKITKSNGELLLVRKEYKTNFFKSFEPTYSGLGADININSKAIYPGKQVLMS